MFLLMSVGLHRNILGNIHFLPTIIEHRGTILNVDYMAGTGRSPKHVLRRSPNFRFLVLAPHFEKPTQATLAIEILLAAFPPY